MKKFGGKKTEFALEFVDFDSLEQVANNFKPNYCRSESAATVSSNPKILWKNIVQNKTALPTEFISHEVENNNKEIISTNFLKTYIQNQNHENLLITNEMC